MGRASGCGTSKTIGLAHCALLANTSRAPLLRGCFGLLRICKRRAELVAGRLGLRC